MLGYHASAYIQHVAVVIVNPLKGPRLHVHESLPWSLADYFLHLHTDASTHVSLVQKVDTVPLQAHDWPALPIRKSKWSILHLVCFVKGRSGSTLDLVILESRRQKAKSVKTKLPMQEVGIDPRIKGSTAERHGVSHVLQCPNALDSCLPCSMHTLV